ncbi:hypothetical protein CVT26_005203, partial [Gymnopilus dilepis]
MDRTPLAPFRGTAERNQPLLLTTRHRQDFDHIIHPPTTISFNSTSPRFTYAPTAEFQLLRIKADTSTTDPIHRPPYPSTQPRKSATSKVAGRTWGIGRRRAASQIGRVLPPTHHGRLVEHGVDSPTTTLSTSPNQEPSDLYRGVRTDLVTMCLTASRTSSRDSTRFANHHIVHSDVDIGEIGRVGRRDGGAACMTGRVGPRGCDCPLEHLWNRPVSSTPTSTRFAMTPIGCEYETPPFRAAHATPPSPRRPRLAPRRVRGKRWPSPGHYLLSSALLPHHTLDIDSVHVEGTTARRTASRSQPAASSLGTSACGSRQSRRGVDKCQDYDLLPSSPPFQSNTTPSRSLAQTRTRTTRSSRKAAGRGIARNGGGGVSPESLAVAASSPSVSLLPMPHPQYAMAPSQTETRNTARSGKAAGV